MRFFCVVWMISAAGLLQAAPAPLANVARISTGASCAVLKDATGHCWGYNGTGQLGNGSTADRGYTATTVAGLAAVSEIAAGNGHACALLGNGTIQCWGANGAGQLGNGNAAFGSNPFPAPVIGLSGAFAVAVGGGHTCAIAGNAGTVRCWGSNAFGQLGDGSTVSSSSPASVGGISGAKAIGAGTNHSCALLEDGSVECWGSNDKGQLGNASNTASSTPVAVSGLAGAIAISAGADQTCALLGSGAVQCWGDNNSGQLGNGAYVASNIPVAVVGLDQATGIAVGTDQHACALLGNETVWCWGDNIDGQLGDGTVATRAVPVRVAVLSGAMQIAAGAKHSCALTTDGTVHCWGQNVYGELGNGGSDLTQTPFVDGVSGAIAISAGSQHTCALLDTGLVKCWGSNDSGTLGNGSTLASSIDPVTVTNISGATGIGAGGRHTCAVLEGGTVKCWGSLLSNPGLGDGTTTTSAIPVTVKGLSGATAVASGTFQTCALLVGGTVKCWGSALLGNDTLDSSPTPVPVVNLTDVRVIVAGALHMCALPGNGVPMCWNDNTSGQCGDVGTQAVTKPLPVPGLARITAIAAGAYHTCALVDGGSVQCLGSGTHGSMAHEAGIPGAVTRLASVKSIAAGGYHSCGVLDSGAVQCWGQGFLGETGDVRDTLPTTVQGVSGAIAVATGDFHTCALLSSGAVQCWGDNSADQIGNRQFCGAHQFSCRHPQTVVEASATTTQLSSSINASAQGQATELTAVVSDGSGEVTFSDGSTVLCRNPVLVSNGSHTSHCAVAFDTTGAHSLTALYEGDAANLQSIGTLLQTVTAANPFNPDQFGLTGAWYNPATSGQGLLVEVAPDLFGQGSGLLFAGWFSYDYYGNPRWYTLQGTVSSASHVATANIYSTVGGNFNALPKTVATEIGTASIDFSDCTHATLRYSFQGGTDYPGAPTGVVPLARLSAATGCSSSGGGSEAGGDSLLSGAWYNPATSGQGIVFDVAPTNHALFGAWYTYASDGSAINGSGGQRWFTIQSNTYVAGSREAHDVPIYAASGGMFDDVAPITNSQVGTANIVFDSCSSMTIVYKFSAGDLAGNAGSISMQPAGPSPGACK